MSSIANSKHAMKRMHASRNTLVCYKDVCEVFVSREESVSPMATSLDMGNNYIYNIRTPINGNQQTNLMVINM